MTETLLRELLRLRAAGGILASLNEAELRELAPVLELTHVDSGTRVFRVGDRGDRACLVCEGVVELRDPGGVVLARVGPGEIVGETALMIGGERIADAVAVTDCRLAGMSHERFDRLLADNPAAHEHVGGLVLERVQRLRLATCLNRAFGPFGKATVQVLEELSEEVEVVTLRGGETLFEEGDAPDAAYVVMSGRLRVALPRAEETGRSTRDIPAGEIVGEMALLDDSARSGTVFALRNSELARLSRRGFGQLVMRRPEAGTAVTRLAISRLRRLEASGGREEPLPATVGLVGASATAPIEPLARELVLALAEYEPVRLLDSARVDAALGKPGIAQSVEGDATYPRLVQWLHEHESSCRMVVYLADPTWTPWTERCALQLDRTLIVARAEGDPAPGDLERRIAPRRRPGRSPAQELVLVHESGEPEHTDAWLAHREVMAHHHVLLGDPAHHRRLARRLTGNGVGLVLGGGGARGCAHLGVIRAIEELGIPIDMIGGTSIGAVVAGMHVCSKRHRGLVELWTRNFRSVLDYTFPAVSLARGRGLEHNLASFAGDDRIEDRWIPYFALSTNISRAEPVVHSSGSLHAAVRASASVPVLYPPVLHGEDYLVDGALLDNVPVDVMRTWVGSGSLIAVDVSMDRRFEHDPELAPQVSGWDLLWRRLKPLAGRYRGPSLLDLLARAMEVHSSSMRGRNRDLADLYLHLSLPDRGFSDFGAVTELAREGYEESIEPLREWAATARGAPPNLHRPPGDAG